MALGTIGGYGSVALKSGGSDQPMQATSTGGYSGNMKGGGAAPAGGGGGQTGGTGLVGGILSGLSIDYAAKKQGFDAQRKMSRENEKLTREQRKGMEMSRGLKRTMLPGVAAAGVGASTMAATQMLGPLGGGAAGLLGLWALMKGIKPYMKSFD